MLFSSTAASAMMTNTPNQLLLAAQNTNQASKQSVLEWKG